MTQVDTSVGPMQNLFGWFQFVSSVSANAAEQRYTKELSERQCTANKHTINSISVR